MKEGLEVKLARFVQKIQLPLMEVSFNSSKYVHEILLILLQNCSIILPDDEWIKNNAKCLQNFKENWERKFEEKFLDLKM